MNFNVDFHYPFDTDLLRYSRWSIKREYQLEPSYDELWNRHPDLTLLAIL